MIIVMDDKRDICFYGTVLVPAQIEQKDQNLNVLNFSKPRWVPDEDAAVCYNCASRFNAVRRKHHCRQCGRVFCTHCCKQKMPLQHLSYLSDQRVCTLCQNFVILLVKAQSSNMHEKLEAAVGLSEMCQEARLIISFVEMGGVIALVFLANERDQQIIHLVLKAMFDLAAHSSLHSYMASIGIVKALNRLLMDADGNEASELAVDVVNLMSTLCSTEQTKLLAVEEGVVDTLFTMCHANASDAVCISVLKCISHISESDRVCDLLADHSRRGTLVRLLTLASSSDQRVQEVALRILWHISASSVWNRHRLIEEDVYNGSSLADIVINHLTTNQRVLTLAVCLLANLAVSESAQGSLTRHLVAMCSLLESAHFDVDLLRHTARGIASFARFRCNSETLMKNFHAICEKLISANDEQTRHYGCQVALMLLGSHTDQCINVLLSAGVGGFLHCLGHTPDILTAAQHVLNSKLPSISCPPKH